MSYDLWVYAGPDYTGAAVQAAMARYLETGADDAFEGSPALARLVAQALARYPALEAIPEDGLDEAAWSVTPESTGRVAVFAILRSRVDEVATFLVEAAHALGLFAFDPQAGHTYAPAGSSASGTVAHARPGPAAAPPQTGIIEPGAHTRTGDRAAMTIQVIPAAARGSTARQLEEAAPLEEGEQVVVAGPVRFHKPYEPGPLDFLRSLAETSARGELRLTDRRLVLLRARGMGANQVYVVPRALVRGVAPAGGGWLRIAVGRDGLPPELSGLKAGMGAAAYGVAGGRAGAGALGAAAGGAGMAGAQGRRTGSLAEILREELGAADT